MEVALFFQRELAAARAAGPVGAKGSAGSGTPEAQLPADLSVLLLSADNAQVLLRAAMTLSSELLLAATWSMASHKLNVWRHICVAD